MRSSSERALALYAALVLTFAGCAKSAADDLFTSEQIAQMPEFQRNILDDGVVTYAEYESAIIAQRSCMEEAGYSPNEIEEIPGTGQIGFTVEADYSDAADPAAADAEFLAAGKQCYDDYSVFVATAWAESLVVKDPAEYERLRAQFVSCLKDAGLDVSADDDLETLMSAVWANDSEDVSMREAINQCEDDAGRLFMVSVKG